MTVNQNQLLGSVDFDVDSLGRLLKEGFSYTGVSGTLDVTSGYAVSGSSVGDPAFRRSLSFPSGFQAEFAPDSLGRLEEVKLTPPQGSQFTLAQYRRAGSGQVSRTTSLGGSSPQMNTTFGFDAFRRLSLVQHQAGTGTPFQKFELTWDSGGDLIRKKHDRVDGSKGDLYDHDDYDRLTGAKQGVPSSEIDGDYSSSTGVAREVTYALDPGQNRTSVTVKLAGQSPVQTTYTPQPNSSRYSAVGGVTPLYDGEGNLAFDGVCYYVYDFRNRLSEVYAVYDESSTQSGSGTSRTAVTSVLSRLTTESLRLTRETFLARTGGDLVAHCRQAQTPPGDPRLKTMGSSGGTGGGASSQSTEDYSIVLIAYYGYDPLNRRIVRNANSVDRCYVYDGWRELEERVVSGDATVDSLVTVRGEGLDEIVAVYRKESGSWIGRTAFQDHLASVVDLRDSQGSAVEAVEYDPYGAASVYVGGTGSPALGSSVGNPWLYTGAGRRDEETGRLYVRNRYLSVGWGRFVSLDTLGDWADRANLGNGYAYVGNAPRGATDPLGLLSIGPAGSGGLGAIGAGGGSAGGGGPFGLGGGPDIIGGHPRTAPPGASSIGGESEAGDSPRTCTPGIGQPGVGILWWCPLWVEALTSIGDVMGLYGHAFGHCLSNCITTAICPVGEDMATVVALLVEVQQLASLPFVALFDAAGAGESASQLSDFKDNALGRSLGRNTKILLDKKLLPPRSAIPQCYAQCLLNMGGNEHKEGPKTTRPYGPLHNDPEQRGKWPGLENILATDPPRGWGR